MQSIIGADLDANGTNASTARPATSTGLSERLKSSVGDLDSPAAIAAVGAASCLACCCCCGLLASCLGLGSGRGSAGIARDAALPPDRPRGKRGHPQFQEKNSEAQFAVSGDDGWTEDVLADDSQLALQLPATNAKIWGPDGDLPPVDVLLQDGCTHDAVSSSIVAFEDACEADPFCLATDAIDDGPNLRQRRRRSFKPTSEQKELDDSAILATGSTTGKRKKHRSPHRRRHRDVAKSEVEPEVVEPPADMDARVDSRLSGVQLDGSIGSGWGGSVHTGGDIDAVPEQVNPSMSASPQNAGTLWSQEAELDQNKLASVICSVGNLRSKERERATPHLLSSSECAEHANLGLAVASGTHPGMEVRAKKPKRPPKAPPKPPCSDVTLDMGGDLAPSRGISRQPRDVAWHQKWDVMEADLCATMDEDERRPSMTALPLATSTGFRCESFSPTS